jgi:hypothetical protein
MWVTVRQMVDTTNVNNTSQFKIKLWEQQAEQLLPTKAIVKCQLISKKEIFAFNK